MHLVSIKLPEECRCASDDGRVLRPRLPETRTESATTTTSRGGSWTHRAADLQFNFYIGGMSCSPGALLVVR